MAEEKELKKDLKNDQKVQHVLEVKKKIINKHQAL